ncbi:MAG: ABC transporter ATP-binding protein [Acidimicrobiales bacterium]|nr:ABC transporter ATP-binding protein [Acidimicrobiales bacterium]
MAVAVGSAMIGLAEIVGLALIMPLISLLTDEGDPTSGIAGTISRITGVTDTDQLVLVLCALIFVAFVTRGFLTLVFRWWALGFLHRNEADVTVRLVDGYLHAPYAFHLQRNSAELLRTLQSAVEATYLHVVGGVFTLSTELAALLGVLVVLVAYEPLAAAGALVYFGGVAALYQRLLRRRTRRLGADYAELSRELFQEVQQGLGGVRELQVRNRQEHVVRRVRVNRDRSAETRRQIRFLADFPKHYVEIAFLLGVAVLSALIVAGNDRATAVPALGLFVAAAFRAVPSMVRLNVAVSSVRHGRPSLRLVVDDLRTVAPWLPAARPAGSTVVPEPTPLRDGIDVEHLSFTYDGADRPALDDVSLHIGPGEMVGLVGPSGAGKSTLVDLILGLHTPDTGTVVVDGRPIGDDLPAWQRRVGLVPQDVYVLDASLRENVAFGYEPDEIDDEQVRDAVQLAQLGDLLASMPDGLDTLLGERGARLSGGERQRIGIARALYSRPSLLVFDEATSSLDTATEARITGTLAALRGQLAMVVIAHRLTTVQGCDRLLFLRDGHLEATGAFEEVRAANPAFAELVRLAGIAPA